MVYIYHPDDSMLGEVTAEFSSLLDEMKTNEFYIKSDDAYWIYSAVEGTSWLIIINHFTMCCPSEHDIFSLRTNHEPSHSHHNPNSEGGANWQF